MEDATEMTGNGEKKDVSRPSSGRAGRRRRLIHDIKKALPLLLFYILFFTSFEGTDETMEEYIQDRVIRENGWTIDANFDEENLCTANKSSTSYKLKQEAKHQSDLIRSRFQLCTGIPNILIVFFYGAIADMYGPKVVFFVTYSGLLVSNILHTLFIYQDWPYAVEYVASFVAGITGSAASTVAGMLTFLSDNFPEQKRMILFFAIFEGAESIGSTIAGHMYTGIKPKLEYGKTMIVFCAVGGASLIFLFFVREKKRENYDVEDMAERSFKGKLVNLFKNIHKLLLKSCKRTTCLLILLVSLILVTVIKLGNKDVTDLFLKDHPFCWSTSHISTYHTVFIVAAVVVAILAVVFINTKISYDNYVVIGFISGIVLYLMKGISSHFQPSTCNIIVIIGAVCGIFSFIATIIMRAMASELIEEHERGSGYGLLAIADSISYVFGSSILLSVYRRTETFSKGFVFYMGAIYVAVSLVLMTIFRFLAKGLEASSE